MPRLSRREALALLGSGAAGLIGARGGVLSATAPPPPTVAAGPGLEELASRLCAAPADRAFDVAAAAIKSGADHRTMLGAIFLCGVRDIRPRPHGILHAVMMVESSFQLAESAAPKEAWLPVLWNLDSLKQAQDDDRVEAGDWKLPPRKAPGPATAEQARREFVAAMEAWDAGRADRALVALLPHHDHDSFFEILWPLACRCSAFVGHKMIYTSQVERVVRRIGWEHAEPPLRHLVMTLLVDRQTDDFERARELAPRLPEGWQRGHDAPDESLALLLDLRERDSRAAQERVVQALAGGLAPATVWDGLRLLGSEVFLRRPGRSASAGRSALLPVHALTVTNAFGHAFRTTKSDATRRLLILQAAAWLAVVRDANVQIVDLSMQGPGIDVLGSSIAGGPQELGPLLERASPAALRLYLDHEPAKAAAYLASLRSTLFRTAQEHHQLKYTAAMQEESRLVHPRWASRILAPAVDYVANPKDAETEVYRRSIRALA